MDKGIKPPIGYKLNSNAAFGRKDGYIAVLLQNWVGNAVLGWTRSVPHVTSMAAEARAILWTLQLAKELNMSRIYLGSDSKAI